MKGEGRTKIGIGLIGFGWIVRHAHLPCLLKNHLMDRIVIYDPHIESVPYLGPASAERVTIVKRLEELLNDDDIGAVIISTPNVLHCEQVVLSLQAGKFVMCEKPLCINKEQTERLRLEVRQHPDRLIPLLPNRYREDLNEVKRLLDEGTIGTLYKAKAHWLRESGIPGSPWFLKRSQSGGGVLIDLGSHVLDLLRWLTHPDKLIDVSARTSNLFIGEGRFASWHNEPGNPQHSDVEDNISVFAKFNDMCWSIDLGWAGMAGSDETMIELFGERGTLTYKGLLGFSTNTLNEESYVQARNEDGQVTQTFNYSNRLAPYHAMLNASLNVIADGKQSCIVPEDVLDTMDFISCIYRNANHYAMKETV